MIVGFVGLGTMGSPMSRVLLQGGHRVVGFDLDPDARERHRAHGGEVARSAAEAARQADIVVTMLPEGRHVHEALFGADGVAEGFPSGGLVVEMSTIDPTESDALRAGLRDHGIAMVDAPVGRTSRHAREGALLLMAGGEPDDLARAKPLFDLLGERTIDCGGPGRGIRMKIVNNFMSTALNALSAEALTLAEASGLDVDRTLEVLAATPAGQGHFGTTYAAKALAGDLTPDFMLKLAHKDLVIAVDLAERIGADSRLGPAALAWYREAMGEGHGDEDWTALYPYRRGKAGLD